jgi:hypothetical protein
MRTEKRFDDSLVYMASIISSLIMPSAEGTGSFYATLLLHNKARVYTTHQTI